MDGRGQLRECLNRHPAATMAAMWGQRLNPRCEISSCPRGEPVQLPLAGPLPSSSVLHEHSVHSSGAWCRNLHGRCLHPSLAQPFARPWEGVSSTWSRWLPFNRCSPGILRACGISHCHLIKQSSVSASIHPQLLPFAALFQSPSEAFQASRLSLS
jgi:hypothetical protein